MSDHTPTPEPQGSAPQNPWAAPGQQAPQSHAAPQPSVNAQPQGFEQAPPAAPQQGQPNPHQPQSVNAWEASGATAAQPGAPTLPKEWGNPLASLAASGLALVGSYLTTIVLLVLAAIGFAISESAKYQFEDAADELPMVDGDKLTDGFGAIARLVTQLTGMSFFSPLHVKISEGGSEAVVKMSFPILLVLLAHVVLTYLFNRLSVKHFGLGTAKGTLVFSALSGAAVATVMTLITRLGALPVSDDVKLHAATAGGWFFCALVTTLAAYFGRMHGGRREVLGRHPLVREAVRGAQVFAAHFVLVSALAAIALVVWLFAKALENDGLSSAVGSLFVVPLFAGQLALSAFGGSALGGVGGVAKGNISGFGGSFDKSWTLFDLPWWAVIISIVIALAAIVAAGSLWALRRRVGKVNQNAEIASWAMLPAVYLAAGTLVWWLDRFGFSVDAGDEGKARVTAGLTGVTVLLVAVVGLLVDLAARYVAPFVLPYLPPAWQARLAGPGARVVASPLQAPVAPGVQVSPAQAAMGAAALGAAAAQGNGLDQVQAALQQPVQPQTQQPQTQQPQAQQPQQWDAQPGAATPAAPARPLDPATKRKIKTAAIVIGAALAALVVASIVISQVNKSMFGPQQRVESLMQSIEKGDAEGAIKAMGNAAPEGSRALMSNAVYGKTSDRLSGFTIGDVREAGKDDVIVSVRSTGADNAVQDVKVHRKGKKFLFFDDWSSASLSTGHLWVTVPEGAEKLQVNGVDINVSDLGTKESGAIDVPALPGTYTIKLPDANKYVVGGEEVARVAFGNNAEVGSANLGYKLGDAIQADAQKAVNAKLDECAKSTDAEPQGCPLNAWVGAKTRMGAWKIDRYPVVKVYGGESFTEFSLNTEDSGSATYSYQQDVGWDKPEWESKTTEDTVSVYGTVAIDGENLVVTFS